MTGRALWLAEALKAEGVNVVECAGWRERGSSSAAFVGVIAHHTAGPRTGDAPSLGVCINGRPGIPGPLANVVLGRSGTAYLVASGKANHGGTGSWKGVSGNSKFLGIEAENTGTGQTWPNEQLDAYVRLCTAMLRRIGSGAEWLCGHKEYAPNRKIDPHPLSLDNGRRYVAERLRHPPTWNGTGGAPAPPSTSEGDEFTMDAEAKAALAALTKKVESVGSAVNIALREIGELQKKQTDEGGRATKRWTELFATGAPRKKS